MKELLQQLINKGFKAKTLTTIWTADSYVVNKKAFLVNNICVLLLLEEIKAWFRNEHKIDIIITMSEFSRTYGYKLYYIEENKTVCINHAYEKKESYELALQTGIEQATKLIEPIINTAHSHLLIDFDNNK